jgi:hypothetical protein
MGPNAIPIIEVRGAHRQVGRQIGEHMKPQIQEMLEKQRSDLPGGVAWADMLYQSSLCLAHSRAIYPQYVDELQGIAEGAGVPFDELFLSICEELWEASAWRSRETRAPRGCTDMAARGRATLDGSTLVAHTNDLLPDAEKDLVILEVQAGDEPQFLGVSSGGVAISAGFNAAGISLTGNQVDANDIRPGVPRLLMVRAILAARWLGEALDVCLLPQRASNYNNVIADANGEIYSMEGSATDCEPLYIEGDLLAHANHYVSAPMRRFEADRNDIGGSVIRHNRAMRLLRENYGALSPDLFKKLLADHASYPASICKHGLETVSVFSIIVNINELKAWIGPGRPCQTTYVEHQLDPWTPPKDWPK